jgi:O-antigen ligase
MNMLRQRIELGWHVIALTLLSGAFIPLWRTEALGYAIVTGGGDFFQRVVLLFCYSGLILLWWYRQRAASVALRGWLIWVIIGWAILSVLWSQAPALTIRRSATLVLATLYGLLLAIRYPPATVLRLIGSAMAIIVVSSLIAIALGASWAVMGTSFMDVSFTYPGAWRGVLWHKSALGRICILALIAFGALAYQTAMPWRIWWLTLIVGSVALIAGSQSATAIVVLAMIVICWLGLILFSVLSLSQQFQLTVLSLGIVVPASYLLWSYSEDIALLLNRDLTLTGRLELWQALLPIGWKQSLTGYGFGAFWLDPFQMMDVDISLLRSRFRWGTHAHNGYLDTWLELGFVGLGLICVLLIWVLWYNFPKIKTKQSLQEFTIILFVIFLLIQNFSETILLETGLSMSVYWIILSWAYFNTVQNKRLRYE